MATQTGTSGNDTLTSLATDDTLIGLQGDDTYVVQGMSVTITEDAGEGTDTVVTESSYLLSDHLENLILTGIDHTIGFANTLANVLTGNTGNNWLGGGTGNDSLYGGDGDDRLEGDAGFDMSTQSFTEGTGNDMLSGGSGHDTLTGGSGDDLLDGGAGDDLMLGGSGNDTYEVDSWSDRVSEKVHPFARITESPAGDGSAGTSVLPVFAPDGQKVAFISNAANLVSGDDNGLADVFLKDLVTGQTIRINTGQDGTVHGTTISGPLSFSADGSRIAMTLGGQVYVKDLTSGELLLASSVRVDGESVAGSSESSYAVISPDGHKVLFSTTAFNLVAGERRPYCDLVVKDLDTGILTRITPATGEEVHILQTLDLRASWSADGTAVTYVERGSDGSQTVMFIPLDPMAGPGQPLTATLQPSGAIVHAMPGNVHFTQDSVVFFGSTDPNVSQLGSATLSQMLSMAIPVGIYARNLQTGAVTTLLEPRPFIAPPRDFVSADLQHVLWAEFDIASNGFNLFTLNRQTGETLQVDATDSGTPAAYASWEPYQGLLGQASLSPQGDRVLFPSTASNLDGSIAANAVDIFIRDIAGGDAGGIDLVNSSSDYLLGDYLENLTLTGTGDRIGFGNTLDNVVTGNSGANWLAGAGGNDTLIGGSGNDRLEGDTGLDMAHQTFTQSIGDDVLQGGEGQDTLSGGSGHDLLDGGSGADLMLGGSGNDTYVVDDAADSTQETEHPFTRITTDLTNPEAGGNGISNRPVFAPDGLTVVYVSSAANLVAGDNNGLHDVFLQDLASGQVTRINTEQDGTVRGTDIPGPLSFSADGRRVAMTIDGQVYIKDLDSGQLILASSVLVEGEPVAGQSESNYAVISPDGNKVLFSTTAYNLVAGERRPYCDLVVKDLDTGALTRITPPTGEEVHVLQALNLHGAWSADGSSLTYVQRNADGSQVVMLHSLAGGTAQPLTATLPSGDTLHALPGDVRFLNGNVVFFGSTDPDVSELGTATFSELLALAIPVGIYARNLQTGAVTTLLEPRPYITQPGNFISDDMQHVLWVELDAATGNHFNLFTRNLATGRTEQVNMTDTGMAAANGSWEPYGWGGGLASLSPQGDRVLFPSSASNLDGTVNNGSLDLFIKDIAGQDTGGIDEVRSSLNWTLGLNLENLTLTGTQAINGTGNALDNTLTGNGANNALIGGEGHDRLDGGQGADTMSGGTGNDTYVVDAAGDVVTELSNSGQDTVLSYRSLTLSGGVENLELLGTATLNGTGNSLANRITGNSANNSLTGGSGVDTLTGGLGNDTYYVDNLLDTVVEAAGEGADRVISSVNWTLGDNLESLGLSGSVATTAVGNSLANSLTGNGLGNLLRGGLGNDTLNGGAGADTLEGGGGNDDYYVDVAGDQIVELAGEGTDRVLAYLSWTLGANIENLTLLAGGAMAATGNTQSNTLVGNSSVNVLTGLGGNDVLHGHAGNDTLSGNAGTDTLYGGTGSDLYRLVRGDGADLLIEDSTSADRDVLLFDDLTVAHDQLWFRRVAMDLEVRIMGTGDRVTVRDWYNPTTNRRVEEIHTADGHVLTEANVQNLVTAMSSFAVPPLGQTSLTAAQHAALDPVIAANWS